jgi:hypothetical protein
LGSVSCNREDAQIRSAIVSFEHRFKHERSVWDNCKECLEEARRDDFELKGWIIASQREDEDGYEHLTWWVGAVNGRVYRCARSSGAYSLDRGDAVKIVTE